MRRAGRRSADARCAQGVQLGGTTITSWPSACADAGHKLQFLSNGTFICGCEFGFTPGANGSCVAPTSSGGSGGSGSTISVSPAGVTVVGGATLVDGALSVSSTTALTGDLNINNGKFTVAAASGNTAVAGNLTVGGVSVVPPSCTGAGAALQFVGGAWSCLCIYTALAWTTQCVPPTCQSGYVLQYNPVYPSPPPRPPSPFPPPSPVPPPGPSPPPPSPSPSPSPSPLPGGMGGGGSSPPYVWTPNAWTCVPIPTLPTPITCSAGQMLAYTSGISGSSWACVPIIDGSSSNGFLLNAGVYQCTGSKYLQYDTSQLALGRNPWGCYGPPPVPNFPPSCTGTGYSLQSQYNAMDGSTTVSCVCTYTGVAYNEMNPVACVASGGGSGASAPKSTMASFPTVRDQWNSGQVHNCTQATVSTACAFQGGLSCSSSTNGICINNNGAAQYNAAVTLNVMDGDTSTCAQFTNDHCYEYTGMVFGNNLTGQQVCDAYVTIDLGATYYITGMTIYGSTSNAADTINILSLPAYANPTPAKFGAANPPFTAWQGGQNNVGLFSSTGASSAEQNNWPYPFGSWANCGGNKFCCGGNTGFSCPSSGSPLYGSCPPPYSSGTPYAMPPWSDSRTDFLSGYSIDFSSGVSAQGYMQLPSSSPTWTRYITVVANAGKPGSAGTTKLNLCEVVIRGNVYSA